MPKNRTLRSKIENRDDFGCPRLLIYISSFIHLAINFYLLTTPRITVPCSKTKVFNDWLKNEQQRETSKNGEVPISMLSVFGLDDTRERYQIIFDQNRTNELPRSKYAAERTIYTIRRRRSDYFKKFFPVDDQCIYSQQNKCSQNSSQLTRSMSF